MKKLIIGTFCLLIHLSVSAESSKRQSIEELLEITNVDSMVASMYDQMDHMLIGMGKQMGVKPSEQDVFDNYMRKIAAAMKEEMSWEKMKDPMIDIYLKHYTETEVQDMLNFYRSETGRSLIEKMPMVMGESMLLSQEMMNGFMPTIQRLSEELKKDLEAHRRQE